MLTDDSIGADGSFNLLEYADADLDHTLIEEHDKNMFDEHLGIKQPGDENSQEAPSEAPKEEKAPEKAEKTEPKAEEEKMDTSSPPVSL
jgi:hypothetical protein